MSHFPIAKNITNNWFIFQDINILIQFTFQLFLRYSNLMETFFRSTLIHKLCHFCGIPAATGKVKGLFLNLNGIHIHQKLSCSGKQTVRVLLSVEKGLT